AQRIPGALQAAFDDEVDAQLAPRFFRGVEPEGVHLARGRDLQLMSDGEQSEFRAQRLGEAVTIGLVFSASADGAERQHGEMLLLDGAATCGLPLPHEE